ncbi:hypothetical protein HanRHA438_Chr01g0019821 [Helianthus annuus]|nr:hypothetical protein HanIR_Chr01g0021101 [Helianthus annuus]KAJ0947776.1 hypothetical protein HanRHA438_Chr01g0019821 [Helianthus annuus]
MLIYWGVSTTYGRPDFVFFCFALLCRIKVRIPFLLHHSIILFFVTRWYGFCFSFIIVYFYFSLLVGTDSLVLLS